jgi:8-oxo-dGTP pyrophosphatase MutT (NUDIX family)
VAAEPPEVEQVSSRTVYSNQWLSVREDVVRRSDGSTGIYGVVDKPPFAVVIARDTDGSFHLVEQYRYTVGRRFYEFPQGATEGVEQPALEIARSELREETGLTAARWTHLGHAYGAYGFCNQPFDVYLAEELVAGEHRREATEQDMRHVVVSSADLEALIASGDIKDACSLAAYGLLLLHER